MLASIILTVSLLVQAPTTVDVVVVTVPVRGDVVIPLTPNGRVEVRRDPSVKRIRLEIERVLAASMLGPAFNTHVAWAVSADGVFENLGEIAMDRDRGRLEATTRFEQLGILI